MVKRGGDHGSKEGKISTHVGVVFNVQRLEDAVLAHTQLAVGHVVAPVGIGHVRFTARGNPFYRPADFPRRPGDNDFLCIVEDFATKPATHVGRNHAQLVFGNAEGEGTEQQANGVGVL